MHAGPGWGVLFCWPFYWKSNMFVTAVFLVLPCFLAPQVSETNPLTVTIVEGEATEALWLSNKEWEADILEKGHGWSQNPLAATLESGVSVPLGPDGRVELQVPPGGGYLAAKGKGTIGLAGVYLGMPDLELPLRPANALSVRLVDTAGNPVTETKVSLFGFRLDRTHSENARKRHWAAATTDELGVALFPPSLQFGARGFEPTPGDFLEAGLEIRHPLLFGEVVPKTVTWEDWQRGELQWATIPLGYLEVMPLPGSDPEGFGGQMHYCRGNNQTTPIPFVEGRGRIPVGLGENFKVHTTGGTLVSAIATEVKGPTKPGEVVRIGPIDLQDKVPITLVCSLTPEHRATKRASLAVHLGNPEPMAPFARTRIAVADLGEDGVYQVHVTREFAQDPSSFLKVGLQVPGAMIQYTEVRADWLAGEPIQVELQDPELRKKNPGPAGVPVTGRVLDPFGQPIPWARVQVLEEILWTKTEAWSTPRGALKGGALADRDGRFEFTPGQDSRRFRLVALAPGLGMKEPLSLNAGHGPLELTLEPLQADHRATLPQTNYPSRFQYPGTQAFALKDVDGSPLVRRKIRYRWAYQGEDRVSGHANDQTDGLGVIYVRPIGDVDSGDLLEFFSEDGEGPHLHGFASLPDSGATVPATTVLGTTLAGRLVTEEGQPMVGVELQLRDNHGSSGREAIGPLVNVRTDDQGKFRFIALPDDEYYTVSVVRGQRVEILKPGVFSEGNREVKLVGARLGAVSLALVLPESTGPGDFQFHLVDGEGLVKQVRTSARDRLRMDNLKLGTYTVQVTLGPHSHPPKISGPVVLESAPFQVVAVLAGEYSTGPTLDLAKEIQSIPVELTFKGQVIRPPTYRLWLREARGGDPPDGLRLIHDSKHLCKVLLPRGREWEVIASARFSPMRTDQAWSDFPTLVSKKTAIQPGVGKLVLPLEVVPPVRLKIDPEVFDAAKPYEILASIERKPTDPVGKWAKLNLGSQATRLPRARADFVHQWVGKDGSIELQGYPDWNGGLAPIKVFLGLGKRSSTGDLPVPNHEFSEPPIRDRSLSIAFLNRSISDQLKQNRWLVFLPKDGPKVDRPKLGAPKPTLKELNKARYSVSVTPSAVEATELSVPLSLLNEGLEYLESIWLDPEWVYGR